MTHNPLAWRDDYLDDTLVGRIVETNAAVYLTSPSNVRIFEADVLRGKIWLHGKIWETGDELFPDERSALGSLEERLGVPRKG